MSAKKIVTIAILIIVVSFGFTSLSLAEIDLGAGMAGDIAGKSGYDPSDAGPTALSQKVGTIIKFALSLVGMIFFALAVYAGILWMTASGNDEQVSKATNILKAAVIGLIIAISAYSITYFVTLKL